MIGASIVRWIAAKAIGLPKRHTGNLATELGLRVPMRDGVELAADRYYAPDRPFAPVVLIRSPYGRGAINGIIAGIMAERGMQVLVQSVRGTCGSGGSFDPMRQEASDGADTVAWIRAQPWFGGAVLGFGTSYLGNAQWALADAMPDGLDGLGLSMTLSDFRDELRSHGGQTLEGTLGWTNLMRGMVGWQPGEVRRMKRPDSSALTSAHRHLPLGTLDVAAFGDPVPWWRDWTGRDDLNDPWWRAFDHTAAPARLAAPTTMVAGWQDIFLPFQLRDFAARQAAGRPSWLTIGPWGHSSPKGMTAWLKESILLFMALARGEAPLARAPVRLFVQGANEWRDYSAWPPPQGKRLRLTLDVRGKLVIDPDPMGNGSARFTYDPVDPTPSMHGPAVMGGGKVQDMTALEGRTDTISFTSEPLPEVTDIVGPVSLELAVRSNRENTDFFACLCEVDGKGRPIRITDGYIRLHPGAPQGDADGVRRITIECWPTAYRVSPGRRLRLIVASGAFPRYARNPGTGEPLATATELLSAEQEVLCGGAYGSSLVLTV